jgi:hypothetical protein
MKLLEFLEARTPSRPMTDSFPIGETGFSFHTSQRPAAALAPWVAGDAIPANAREVLEKSDRFADIAGLLRVPVESDASNEVRMEWVLARCASGLVSMIVRDASTCAADTLLDDMAFAVMEAERYCAQSVIVLIEDSDPRGAPACVAALRDVFGTGHIERNRLYGSAVPTRIPLWFANLSPLI